MAKVRLRTYADEIDSYMYQTVGHDAVHVVAAAMGVPLYRACIRGQPNNQGPIYGQRDPTSSTYDAHDETEDLYHLLREVKAHHPDIEGVSVGAILSNYQRVRVEHVALRPDIQMQPLAYLWQRNQTSLLHEMNASGLDAIVIKVAGIGLGERDLGKTLRVLTPKLEHLHQLYGAHVCGEGGEYETLSLDSPLFQQRISMYVGSYLLSDDTEVVVHHDAAFASVSYLRLRQTSLIDKEHYGPEMVRTQLSAPPLLDPLGIASLRAIERAPVAPLQDSVSNYTMAAWLPSLSVAVRGPWLSIANLCASASSASFEDGARDLFARLDATLRAHGYERTDVTHINVYLASQVHFAAINAVYRTFFGAAPPSRACIALPVGHGAHVMLDVVACRPSAQSERRSLHVQSRSYWAPANIGPYSQAVGDYGRIYMAGQIGMEPCTLDVPSSPSLQLALALQHQRRIALAVREWGTQGHIEGGICWLAMQPDHSWSEAVGRAWQAESEADESHCAHAHPHAQSFDDNAWLATTASTIPLLCVYLGRDALPKRAVAEWQLTASMPSEEADAPQAFRGTLVQGGMAFTYRVLAQGPHSCGIVLLTPSEAPDSLDEQAHRVLAWAARSVHAKLLYPTTQGPEAAQAHVASLLGADAALSCLPVFGWSWAGEDLDSTSVGALVWT